MQTGPKPVIKEETVKIGECSYTINIGFIYISLLRTLSELWIIIIIMLTGTCFVLVNILFSMTDLLVSCLDITS